MTPAPRGFMTWLREGLGWRWRALRENRLKPLFGVRNIQWARVVMDRQTERQVRAMECAVLDVLEISGTKWASFGFRSYRSIQYPECDVCAAPLATAAYDLVIAEQVLEHVAWPYRAVRHVHDMLRPGGVFLVTTPFLVRVHAHPTDCSRWTELGMKHLLAEGGFALERIETSAWGNRACVRANLNRWASWVPWLHSLRNEPDFPVVVWAFARKQG